MSLVVASRRTSETTLRARYGPSAVMLDVTSRGPHPWIRLSPFFPHGGIPVPFSPGMYSMSVEGIWQGLKVFEREDVDPSRFAITSMRGIKRSARALGRVLGHREGIGGQRLLPYLEARRAIYLPSYRWVLDHRLQDQVAELKWLAEEHDVVLLDYETNGDVADLSRPLSHASLVKRYVEGDWPEA